MAVPKSLGLLNCIRIWHDNIGPGSSASWFLKYIIVKDLQTVNKFHFISQKWFAVEKDDGKIERVLPAASEIEKSELSYILSKQVYHSISDGHLWFSIFSRPPSNKFTRVQRCTCCFVLLFLSMLLNILYYDSLNEAKMNNSTNTYSLSFGSFYINSDEIIIGVIIELFSLIPSILIVQFFRRIRSRHQQISPLHQAFNKTKQSSKAVSNNSKSPINRDIKKQKSPITFPWWCLFIVYGLCLILVGVSITFIIASGIEFGDLKSQKWLISILSGLFSSIFLTQPLKILCLAIFFAFFFRNSNEDKQANEYIDDKQINLNNDEEYLHSNQSQSPIRVNCLTKAEVDCARHHRLKEIQMWSIIREIFTYICFLTVLSVIIYSNRDSNSFFQVNHLRKHFLNQGKTHYDYTKISTINEYWKWLENNFIENVRAQQWYNKRPAEHLRGYINDKSNRLIGWPIMRQLRIKSKSCQNQKIDQKCLGDYNLLNEEKHSFQPGWIDEIKEKYNLIIHRSFEYQTSEQLDTYVYIGEHETYSGNGYVYEFRGHLSEIRNNLSELHKLGWIDNKTRAIFIQLTLYNPNVQLFTSVTFLTEFLSTGGIYPQYRFEPMNFYAFASIQQLICIIIYMIIILYFMWIEIRLLFELKWKYFHRFWSFINFGIIICSWTGLCIYIWRYKESKRISELFEEKKGSVYINLQLASYVDNILTYLFGFCCFFGTIKFLHLCRFNRRLSLFNQTLKNARNELISFLFMFLIIFFSFVCLFYLLFISKIASCSTLFNTIQMLIEMTLLKFNAKELIETSLFLGPFCFSLFIILICFICMSMFITIINDNFRLVRQKVKDDPEIFSFMFKKFLHWTGLKKQNELEIAEERDARMRSQYLHPIDVFPQKIDQLLKAIDRIYTNQRLRNQQNTV